MAGPEPSPPDSDTSRRLQLQTVLKQVALSAGQTVVVAWGPQVLAHRGDLNLTEVQDIAVQVAEGWHDHGQSARIQFMRLPLLADERLLYTLPLADGYLLTVVELADGPLGRVSQLARQLVPLLEGVGLSGYNGPT